MEIGPDLPQARRGSSTRATNMGAMNRRELFQRTWRELEARGEPEPILRELEERWSEGHRLYHNLEHLDFCLTELQGVSELVERPAELFFAAFAHDVVYDPRSGDNESRSVEWALRVLEEAAVPAAACERIAWLVLATRQDRIPAELEAQLLMDADLAILGRSPDEYTDYERRIRKEYRHLPRLLYRAGRARVLKRLLKRHAIFLSEAFRNRYEDTARSNLRQTLARLKSLRGRVGL
jgi:predicted metal-dependent HD superfamily phosphohydrolase